MRQYFSKSLYVSLIACILLGALCFTGCEPEGDDLTVIKLEVFGPSPALRGGELKFIGQNMDKVTAVIIPDGIEITEFVSKTSGELVLVIPQNAKPGELVLKTPQGDIKTKTPLSFSEPISLDNFSPATVKAADVLTINGDYLNLIAQVIFADGVAVDSADFISQTRYKIEVTVPIEAQTGKVIVSNGAEIPILVYSETELQVTLPVISSVSPIPVKPGTPLLINGTNFQLVKSIEFFDAVVIDNFTINEAKTQLTVAVPDNVKEGLLKLIAYSGVEVLTATDLTLVGPAVTSIAPSPVKNGNQLTIQGSHLDLVTTAVFVGDVEGVIDSKTATSLTVTVPLTAKAGVVVLNTLSGKTAQTAAINLVVPTITSIAPLSLTAGEDITISGTNLDLISKVIFGGEQSVDVTPVSSTSLVVTVPMTATSGKVTLQMANGTELESTESLIVEAANKPVVTAVNPAAVKPGNMITLTGSKLHLVETIYFGAAKATQYGSRNQSTIEVYVPATAATGKISAKLVAFDGAEVLSPEFIIAGTDPITDLTKMVMDFEVRSESDWHGPDWDNWGGSYDSDKAKADGYITLVSRPGWWVLGCNHPDPNGGWPSVNSNDYVLKVDIKTTTPILITGGYEFIFKFGGEDVTSQLMVEGNYIVTPNNDWATITIPIAGKLSNPTKNTGDFGIVLNYSDGGTDFAGLCFDNIRFDPK